MKRKGGREGTWTGYNTPGCYYMNILSILPYHMLWGGGGSEWRRKGGWEGGRVNELARTLILSIYSKTIKPHSLNLRLLPEVTKESFAALKFKITGCPFISGCYFPFTNGVYSYMWIPPSFLNHIQTLDKWCHNHKSLLQLSLVPHHCPHKLPY